MFLVGFARQGVFILEPLRFANLIAKKGLNVVRKDTR